MNAEDRETHMAEVTFKRVDRVVLVDIAYDSITIQELYNLVREYEGSLANIDVEEIISASGKEVLGGDICVGITLCMINSWRLQFADRPGPTTMRCLVGGGNLVAINDYNNDPIKPSEYTQVVIAQSTSAAIIPPNLTLAQFLALK